MTRHTTTTNARFLMAVGSVAALAVILAVLAMGTALAPVADPGDPTFGPVPADIYDPATGVDWERMPTFIPVADQNGEIAGYVDSLTMLGSDNGDGPVTVFALDKSGEPIGQFYPEVGFVPFGDDVSMYDRVPVTITENDN